MSDFLKKSTKKLQFILLYLNRHLNKTRSFYSKSSSRGTTKIGSQQSNRRLSISSDFKKVDNYQIRILNKDLKRIIVSTASFGDKTPISSLPIILSIKDKL